MKRIILKISGEAFSNDTNSIDEKSLNNIAKDIKLLRKKQIEVVIITGGGNIWRGRSCPYMDDVLKDEIGMLATMMNSLALADSLTKLNIKVKVRSTLEVEGMIKKYNPIEDRNLLNDNILIIAGGVGLPFHSTDTALVQRAIELKCDTVLMGKNIDGVYDKDPKLGNAKRYDKITHQELFDNHIKVGPTSQGIMDMSAETMLLEHPIDVIVYKATEKNAISRLLTNNLIHTLITK